MNYLPQLFLLERNKRARGNTAYGGDIEQSVAHGLQFRYAPLQPVSHHVMPKGLGEARGHYFVTPISR